MNNITLENLEFEKYHALGNDYIIINDLKWGIPEEKKSALAIKLCENHFWIGADGLIFVCKSNVADIKMRLFNYNGLEAEMCGNGLRCFSKYIYENNFVEKDEIKIETLKGTILTRLKIVNNRVNSVEIDMGPPILNCEEIPVLLENSVEQCVNEPIVVLDKIFRFTAVLIEKPHAVIFVEKILNNDELNRYGATLESNECFPNKVDVEFVKVISKEEGIMKVFESGVGITKSSFTGACASVVAGTILGIFNENVPITIHNDAGDLKITYIGKNIYMEGPTEKVFEGVLEKVEI